MTGRYRLLSADGAIIIPIAWEVLVVTHDFVYAYMIFKDNHAKRQMNSINLMTEFHYLSNAQSREAIEKDWEEKKEKARVAWTDSVRTNTVPYHSRVGSAGLSDLCPERRGTPDFLRQTNSFHPPAYTMPPRMYDERDYYQQLSIYDDPFGERTSDWDHVPRRSEYDNLDRAPRLPRRDLYSPVRERKSKGERY